MAAAEELCILVRQELLTRGVRRHGTSIRPSAANAEDGRKSGHLGGTLWPLRKLDSAGQQQEAGHHLVPALLSAFEETKDWIMIIVLFDCLGDTLCVHCSGWSGAGLVACGFGTCVIHR